MEQIKDKWFEKYRDFIFDRTGMNFTEGKRALLETKIRKAMRRSGFESMEEFYNIITSSVNGAIYEEFINIVTTNTTEFFRENEHFEFVKNNINTILYNNPEIKKNREIRVWCAASSSGQEPVTIAITLREALDSSIKIKLLATDISSEVLTKAMNGVYNSADCGGISDGILLKYFDKSGKESYKVKQSILELISYRQFNLMNEFNFKKPFDIIFCRNVMIYFNRDTQELVVNKFYNNLIKGGYFFTGHSEGLVNKKHNFSAVAPSIYYKD